MSEYEGLTVAELKELLSERGLTVSGKKADLIARLEEADDAPNELEADLTEEDAFEDDFDDDFDEWDEDEETVHTAKQKPELDDATKAALAMRKEQSKKQPRFRRQEWYRYKRLAGTGWRKPKGMHSSQRLNRKYRSPMARVGYGKVADARGLHPSGFREVLVHNPAELDGLDSATEAVRIGGTVGGRKRMIIHQKADELGLRVLNRRDIEERGEA